TAGVPFTSSQTGVSSTASSVVASGGMWGRCGKQRGGPRPTALLREAAACGRLREAVAKGDLREAATEPDGSAPAGSACRAGGPAAGRPHPHHHPPGNAQSGMGNRPLPSTLLLGTGNREAEIETADVERAAAVGP